MFFSSVVECYLLPLCLHVLLGAIAGVFTRLTCVLLLVCLHVLLNVIAGVFPRFAGVFAHCD